MNTVDIVDLCSDEDEVDIKPVKQEPDSSSSTSQNRSSHSAENVQLQKFKVQVKVEGYEDKGHSSSSKVAQSSSCTSDQESSVVDGCSPTSATVGLSAPVCRQFWKAGEYEAVQASKIKFPNGGKTHLSVHPKFLHSNATSHKWALGAIAELIDNAFDEIQNGATFVIIDKIFDPRSGSPALLIQDDGGGMSPDSIRRCTSFGFSEKKTKSAIGQYGNGFKTSTMRLGADAIVFSRCATNRVVTESIGLLSYTFLRLTGHDSIVVPMVDYEFCSSTGMFKPLLCPTEKHFSSNLSAILQWSPYRTEAELLKQFDDIGHHGTKVIVFNLWLNDDGGLELDFESDKEDIMISGAPKIVETANIPKMLTQQHIANRYHYSLRLYSSILYLRRPENFRIILRGRVVEHCIIARDLKYPELILYRPQMALNREAEVTTIIGFLKDAPNISVHGFNIYHKNRLILPFWRVINQTNSRGRGVVGVLEANFIEPTHDKQDFEKTPLLQRLELRLKQMALEYWDFHCGLIGMKQAKTPMLTSSQTHPGIPVALNSPLSAHFSAARPMGTALSAAPGLSLPGQPTYSCPSGGQSGFSLKRKEKGQEEVAMKRQVTSATNATINGNNREIKVDSNDEVSIQNLGTRELIAENKKLCAQCVAYERIEEELELKVQRLKLELKEVNREYERLLKECETLDVVKLENM